MSTSTPKNNAVLRLIAFLLVPCLIVDPVTASSLQASPAAFSSFSSSFTEQALGPAQIAGRWDALVAQLRERRLKREEGHYSFQDERSLIGRLFRSLSEGFDELVLKHVEGLSSFEFFGKIRFAYHNAVPRTNGTHRRLFNTAKSHLFEKITAAYPPGSHPILYRVDEVGPEVVLSPGQYLSDSEGRVVDNYNAHLVHAQALAAFDAWMYHAKNFKIGKFGDKLATTAKNRWLNMCPFLSFTQAAEGKRDIAAAPEGRYGIPAFLGLEWPIEVQFADDAVEVTKRLEQENYLANTSIGAYALGKLYALHKKPVPHLKLPDESYILGVAGPKKSGVKVDLDPKIWVQENMRRAGAVRNRLPNEVRVTGVLIRERHWQLINDTLQVLQIRAEHIPDSLKRYFAYHEDGVSFIPADQITSLKEFVKISGGLLQLKNTAGGSVTMVTDGDLMPVLGIGLDQADIAFGAGGVAESMIKARAGYLDIDYQAALLSYLATEDGKPGAVQVLDPEARILRKGKDLKGQEIDEIALAKESGLPIKKGRVNRLFTLNGLTGGPYSSTVVASPLGDPQTGDSNFVPGLHQVEVINGGRDVRITLLLIDPSGRKSLFPIMYETGLRNLNQEFAQAKLPEAKAKALMKIGRLFGDLRIYDSAQATFERAIEVAPELEKDIFALQNYYRGMQELLDKSKPDVTAAKYHFAQAQDLGYVHAQMMLEVIEYGGPRTVESAEIVNAIDNLVKQSPAGRSGAIDILVNRIRKADIEHAPTIILLVEKLAEFQQLHSLDATAQDLISRIAQAVTENKYLGARLSAKLNVPAAKPPSGAKLRSPARDENPTSGKVTADKPAAPVAAVANLAIAILDRNKDRTSELVMDMTKQVLFAGGARRVITEELQDGDILVFLDENGVVFNMGQYVQRNHFVNLLNIGHPKSRHRGEAIGRVSNYYMLRLPALASASDSMAGTPAAPAKHPEKQILEAA
jgi:fructose-1,6-bisphosphatase/sedoheptulose 1,7-bisphosphatase-like protein